MLPKEDPRSSAFHKRLKMEKTTRVMKESESRVIESKFVTVVSVEEDKLLEEKGFCSFESSSSHEGATDACQSFQSVSEITCKSNLRPQPAPRQFVTVVSVEGAGNANLNANNNVSLESNLKVRLDIPAESGESGQIDSKHDVNPEDSPCDETPDQIVVFRLPGERLGLGLKFDGGIGAVEKVRRLFIQSVAPDSPAARATVPWGDLEVGDQILHIEGRPVNSMTRVECVSRLKEASVKLTIGVLKGNGSIPETEENKQPSPSSSKLRYYNNSSREVKVSPPPPLPPRLQPRKIPARPPKDTVELPPPPEGFEDLNSDEPQEKVAKLSHLNNFAGRDFDGDLIKYISQSRRQEDRLPPTPAVYLDLLSEEEKASRARCESESDETNSSASTVVDRLSISSSRTVSRNSSFNATSDATRFDLARALSPFEHLEEEFISEKRQRSLSTPHLSFNEYSSPPRNIPIEIEMNKENTDYLNLASKNGLEMKKDTKDKEYSSKLVKSGKKSLSFSLKSRPFSWHNHKEEEEIKVTKAEFFISAKKSSKRPAPLPPPRSIISTSSTIGKVKALKSLFCDDTRFSEGKAKEPEAKTDIDPSWEYDNDSELLDVFENEDYPSIVEKPSKSSDRNENPSVSKDSVRSEFCSSSSNSDSAIVGSEHNIDKDENRKNESSYEIQSLTPTKSVDNLETDPTFRDNVNIPLKEESKAELSEPLYTESYNAKCEYFIDRVSNPSYGLPPLPLVRNTTSKNDQHADTAYEDINTSSTYFLSQKPDSKGQFEDSFNMKSDESEEGIADEDKEDKKALGSSTISDISSLSSNCSLSTISLSSREWEDVKTEDITKQFLSRNLLSEDPSNTTSQDLSFDNKIYSEVDTAENPPYDDIDNSEADPTSSDQKIVHDHYDDVGVTDVKKVSLEHPYYDDVSVSSTPNIESLLKEHKSFSKSYSQSRIREDLGEILRKDLALGKDAHVEVEEEEVVESTIECETKDEVLLVLRALREDNFLSLDQQQSETRTSSLGEDTKYKTASFGKRSGREVTLDDAIDTVPSKMGGTLQEDGRSQEVTVEDEIKSGISVVSSSVTHVEGQAPSYSLGKEVSSDSEYNSVYFIKDNSVDLSFGKNYPEVHDRSLTKMVSQNFGDSVEGQDPTVGGSVSVVNSFKEDIVHNEPSSNKFEGRGESYVRSTEEKSISAGDTSHIFETPPVETKNSESKELKPEIVAEHEELCAINTEESCVAKDEPVNISTNSLSNLSSNLLNSTLETPRQTPLNGVLTPLLLDQSEVACDNRAIIQEGASRNDCYSDDPRGRSNVTLYEQRYTTSASQSSPPSHSRLPPDGHEFPSSYSEGLHDKIERLTQYSLRQEASESPSPKVSSVGKVESTGSHSKLSDVSSKSSSSSLSSSDSRSISRWRRQDERSERSVRDKIAMFSTEEKDHQSKPKTRKIDRSESVSSSCMKRSLTEDDVRIEPGVKDVKLSKDSPMGKSSVRKQGKPSVYSSMINVHSSSDSKENVKPASSESDVRGKYISKLNNSKAHPVNLKTKKQVDPEKDEGVSGLNSRSQSLIDIGKPTRMKRHSVGAFDRPSVYKYGIEKPEERERRTSLNNLIEQRRKSMSKLRGLVIPETRARESNESRLPLDLPRISSHTSQTFKTMSLPREETKAANLYKADSISSIDSCSSSTSRHSSTPGSLSNSKGITKLSPAHTRKHSFGNSKSDSLPPLCSRSVRNQSPVSDFSGSSSTLTTISPQRSFDRSGTPTSEMSFESESRYSSERSSYSRTPTLKSFDSRLNNKNEDSDNDSAVSSTQSSFSQSLSPRASPMPDHEDHEDRHSPTRSLRPRHSPQSSFDDLDQKRILKSGSIEAENRRNILKSAKCSSGRSSDEQSTPEIVRKFSKDRTPEPFANKLDSDLKEGQRKHYLRRNESIDSSSSISSIDSSRRNSKDSVIHVSPKQSDAKLGSDTLYDKDAFKETPVRVAYLNEIVDNYEELPDEKGTVFAEVPIQTDFSPQDQINNRERSPTNDKKWNELEQKYTSLKNEQERIEDKISKYITSSDNSPSDKYRSNFKTKKSDFKELANKWKQRAEEDSSSCQPQVVQNLNKIAIKKDDMNVSSTTEVKRFARTEKLEISSFTPSLENSSFYEAREERPNTLNLPRIDIPDRKFSMPEYGTSLKLREKDGDIPSRPTSLIEGTKAMETLQQEGQYLTPLSPSISTDSREDLLDSSESSLSRTGSKEVLDAFSKSGINNSLSPKMSEIMRAFERHDITSKGLGDSHPRMSSLDSTASDDGSQGGCGILYGSVSSLASGQRDQFGSITSLSSSTSIISPQELAQLIEEANHSLEESGTPSHEIVVVVLHREIVGQGSIGITLAGGADYETKEITVHKVIPGSLADRDGRIQKGDRVLSINGKTLRGVSHREALNILKSPRPEVVLVLSRSRSVTPQESTLTQSNGDSDGGFSHRSVFINHVPPPRPPKILESPMDSKSLVSDLPVDTMPRGPPMNITLIKDGAGLGFSLEGGKDSPLGDRPLTIKKVFSGGAADKEGSLKVGDELLGVNSVDLSNMARIEAWNFLKKLPDGKVVLRIRQKLKEEESSGT